MLIWLRAHTMVFVAACCCLLLLVATCCYLLLLVAACCCLLLLVAARYCSLPLVASPVCKRLIEARRKIYRGHLSPFMLSACALVQMLIPVLNIKWVYMHSACFVRDIPPPEYAPGCIMLLIIIFALMAVGILGMRVASADGSSHIAARLYRVLTMLSFLFSLSSGVMFLGYAMPDFNAVSSTQEMLTVRNWGYSQACVKEKMLNHAYVLCSIVDVCAESTASLVVCLSWSLCVFDHNDVWLTNHFSLLPFPKRARTH